MSIRSTFACICATALFGPVLGQYNNKGTWHFGLGVNGSVHATEYDETVRLFGLIPVQRNSTGGAITVTVPVEVHYGFAPLFSLGVYVEPGNYVDSVAAKENSILLIGLQPRFHLVNKERFAWMAGLQLGATNLHIHDPEAIGGPHSRFGGAHVGITTGVGFLFSERIGAQVHLRYLTNTLPLNAFEFNGSTIPLDDVDAELRARGLGLQFGMHLRL